MVTHWVSAALLVPLVLVSCSDDDADDQAAPESVSTSVQAPLNLDTVDLPDTESGLAALFGQMPDDIDGVQRRSTDQGLIAEYGDLNGLGAALQQSGDSGSGGVTVVESISMFGDEPGAQVEASQIDPSTDLVWLIGSFEDEGGAGLVHVALWGEPDGNWMFAVNAATPAMRDALVLAFVEASATSADAPATVTGTALEDLREALPTAAELSSILDVSDMSADVGGGPGIPGSPAFEYIELPTLIGGYMVIFRPPAGHSNSGMIELTLLADAGTAQTVLAHMLTDAAPDPDIVRTTFEVTDMIDDGQGYVLDPEPGSHFTRIIGRKDTLLVGVTIFHGADEDRTQQARALLEATLQRASIDS